MTIELFQVLGAAASAPSVSGGVGWQQDLVTSYTVLRLPLLTGSVAVFGLTFTAVSTLLRIKDKLFDVSEYHARVRRLRGIDQMLKEYRPYEQLSHVFQAARWSAFANVLVHLSAVFWLNWLSSLIGFGATIIMLALVAWFSHLFHVNNAEITHVDQERADREAMEAATTAQAQPKPYARLKGT